MFGVADVGTCLLQVIPADKCVLPGNSHQETQEWPAKVLGLASYGQDKLVVYASVIPLIVSLEVGRLRL